MMCAITKEAGKVFDPNIVLRVGVMEQEKIDVMWALTMWRHVINRVAIVFGVGRNDIYANFRVLVFEFWKITQLYREGNALEIEGSLVIDVTGHAVGVRLRWIQRRQDGPFEAAIITILHVNHCSFLDNISWCRDVTVTCKRAKFGYNKCKLKNKVKHEAAPTRIELFDTSKKIVEKLVEIELVSSRNNLSMRRKMPVHRLHAIWCVAREMCGRPGKNSN